MVEDLNELLHLETFIPLLEAGINDIIFLGAGLFFLISAETRIKRRRVLNSLHRAEGICAYHRYAPAA